jgi:hypothetical protein
MTAAFGAASKVFAFLDCSQLFEALFCWLVSMLVINCFQEASRISRAATKLSSPVCLQNGQPVTKAFRLEVLNIAATRCRQIIFVPHLPDSRF